MNAHLIVPIASALLALTGEGPDRQQVSGLIATAQEANCRDVSFDFEGKEFETGSTAPMKSYTGTFKRRSDGAYFLDTYVLRGANDSTHGLVAILDGTTNTSTQKATEKNASIAIKKQGPMQYAGPGNFREIWLADLVRKFADSSFLYEFEGTQKLDGRECLVVRFRLVYDRTQPDDKTVSELFWIDLERGGHVVRRERRFLGDNIGEITTVHLDRFERKGGQVSWLPTSGVIEARMTGKDGKLIFLDHPLTSRRYDLLPVTLRFDVGLKDEDFSVKARPGDLVSDEVRKARYEFGQYMVQSQTPRRMPTDAEIKANLDRMLADSKVMAKELKASSPLREGPGLAANWPWVAAGLSALGAGFLFYRRLKA